MTFEEALVAKLRATAGVSALVSQRIYPHILPQDPTLPAIVYESAPHAPERYQDGSDTLTHTEPTITCWATTYTGAKTLAAAVLAALDGGAGTWGTVTVYSSEAEEGGDGYDGTTGLWSTTVALDAWYKRS